MVGVCVVGYAHHLAGLGVEERDVIIGVALVGVDGGGYPLAVGAPVHLDSGIIGGVCAAVGEQAHLAGVEVHHCNLAAVLDEGHPLSVGRDERIGAFHAVGRGEHGGLLDDGGVGKVGVILARDARTIDIVVSVAV